MQRPSQQANGIDQALTAEQKQQIESVRMLIRMAAERNRSQQANGTDQPLTEEQKQQIEAFRMIMRMVAERNRQARPADNSFPFWGTLTKVGLFGGAVGSFVFGGGFGTLLLYTLWGTAIGKTADVMKECCKPRKNN